MESIQIYPRAADAISLNLPSVQQTTVDKSSILEQHFIAALFIVRNQPNHSLRDEDKTSTKKIIQFVSFLQLSHIIKWSRSKCLQFMIRLTPKREFHISPLDFLDFPKSNFTERMKDERNTHKNLLSFHIQLYPQPYRIYGEKRQIPAANQGKL